MTSVVDAFPVFGLKITAGPLELRGITDDLIGPLIDLALAGIHAPEYMPFYVPWSTAPAAELPLNFAQHHWRTRAGFSPGEFTLELAVFWEGELVGAQGISTKRYPITRTGETGSWLVRSAQGKGIGTAMRQVFCAFLFDDLGATQITSAAFVDNPSSLGVSRKTGYVENGRERFVRGGELVEQQNLVLWPDDLVRYEHPLTVSGAEALREFLDLP